MFRFTLGHQKRTTQCAGNRNWHTQKVPVGWGMLDYCGVIFHTRTQASSPELTTRRSSMKDNPYTPPK